MSKFYHLMGVDIPFDLSHRFETSWLLPPWFLCTIRALLVRGSSVSSKAFVWQLTTTSAVYLCVHNHLLHHSLGWHSPSPGSRAPLLLIFHELDVLGACLLLLLRRRTHLLLLTHCLSASVPLAQTSAGSPQPLLYDRRDVSDPRNDCVLGDLVLGAMVPGNVQRMVERLSAPYHSYLLRRERNSRLTIHQTSQHALNCAFALFEIIFPRSSPPPFLHLPFLILLLALYLALAYITNATEGFYPYGFLDPSNGHSGRVAAYAFAILAAIIIIFLVVWCLIWARKWLTERVMGMKGKFYGGRERVSEDLEMPRYRGK